MLFSNLWARTSTFRETPTPEVIFFERRLFLLQLLLVAHNNYTKPNVGCPPTEDTTPMP